MFTVIPWEEYACTEFTGMLLQKRRSKKIGDLWGEIHEIRYEAHKLTIVLSWTTTEDPRKRRVEKCWQVEPITLTPIAHGPLYTDKSEFVFKDDEGFDYIIRVSFRLLKSTGRPPNPVSGPLNAVQPKKRRAKPRFRPEFFKKTED